MLNSSKTGTSARSTPVTHLPGNGSDSSILQTHHVLVTPSGNGFFGPTDEALAKLGRERRVAVTIPNFLSLPSILRNSDFIAVAPERVLLPFAEELAIFPTPLNLSPVKMIGVWHELSDRSPAHVWLRDRMTEVATAMK